MSVVRLGAVAAPFDRDLEADLRRVEGLIATARDAGVGLLALPEGALGGYLDSLDGTGSPPPALEPDGAELSRIARAAGDMVVTVGYAERDGDRLYNSAAALTGDGIVGRHRKVHQPLREDANYAAGDSFGAFDTAIGRIGMMICYDKAFPEAARVLAMDGAEIVVCMSAWPGSSTNPDPDLARDRWKQRFDLFDQARALENQVVWVSSNQSGMVGRLRMVASAKIVGPGGEILDDTGVGPGIAVAELDVAQALVAARRSMGHLRDRRPETYGQLERLGRGVVVA